MAPKDTSGRKNVAVNKHARRNFFIDDTYEAGLALVGTEVKSLRAGKATLAEAYIKLEDGEAFLVRAHIPTWEWGNRNNHEPTRPRKLLLHRRELERLVGSVNQKGYTLVPMALYFSRGRVKLEFGLGKGKKLHDKRQDQKTADARREMDRARRER